MQHITWYLKNVKSKWLLAAAIYNVLWGTWVILFPQAIFDLTQIPAMKYPQIWQCVGMIVGVYGLGYGIAAVDPDRHWPITLVGFLGKIFGPIGFLFAVLQGDFPILFVFTLITNDFIWWIPFYKILKRAQARAEARDTRVVGTL